VGSSILFMVMQSTGDISRPYEIWRVNETLPEGAELYWRSTGPIPLDWATVGDLLYIRMRNGSSDELWATDGTDDGMRLVKAELASGYGARFEHADANAIYFESFTSLPVQMWYSRIDANGVTPLDTLGVFSNDGYSTAVYQGDFYVKNGTRVVRVPAGSTQGELVLDGGWDYRLAEMHAIGDYLFFLDHSEYWSPSLPTVLWRYDGQQNRLERIGEYNWIAGMAALRDSVYFVVQYTDGATTQLMRLPNASATAVEAATLEGASLVDGNSPSMVASDSMLYMQITINRGWELWGSDGTAAGTRSITRLFDYDQENKFNNCPCLTVVGDTLYFDKMAKAKSVEMWRVNVSAEDRPLYLPYVANP
jgi:hypothetical protein